MVLLHWPPPDHLWIGQKIAAIPAISAIRLVTKARTSVPAEILAGIVMRKELEDWQRRHHRDNFERER